MSQARLDSWALWIVVMLLMMLPWAMEGLGLLE